MKISNLISILFCFVIISSFSSCEKEKDAMGTLQFECSVPVLKSSGSAITLTSAMVSINDTKGNSIYSNQKIEILNMNGYYISKPLSIKPGDYVLSSFLLCDKNNTIVYASPVKDSPKAYLVQTPLPIDFKISKDQVSKLVPEVISATDAVPSDFGYATFSFNVVETFDLFIAAFAYEESNKDFYMTDALLTISASGKPSMNFKLENKTNTLEIPAGYGEYLLSIKKEGYKTIEKKLSELELNTFNGSSDSSVLKILLEELSVYIFQPDAADGKDVQIADYNPETNYADHWNLQPISWTFSGSPIITRSLIEFNISNIPAGSKIQSAKLYLFHFENPNSVSSGHSGENECSIHPINSPWEENTITWKTQPSYDEYRKVILSKSTDIRQDYVVDVTEFIQEKISNPASNFGFLIKLTSEKPYRSMLLGSSDCPDISKRPKLEITINK